MSKSPDAINLRWYTDETDMAMANHIAALYCRSWGKTAELAYDARGGSDEVARYRCR